MELIAISIKFHNLLSVFQCQRPCFMCLIISRLKKTDFSVVVQTNGTLSCTNCTFDQ